jgi:hypothetical protein
MSSRERQPKAAECAARFVETRGERAVSAAAKGMSLVTWRARPCQYLPTYVPGTL